MRILNVEPGGKVSRSGRLASGLLLASTSDWNLSPSLKELPAKTEGSYEGVETRASTLPVSGSRATTAPRASRSVSPLYAASCAFGSMVVITSPPRRSSPVRMSLAFEKAKRSSWPLSTLSYVFSSRDMPCAWEA